MTAAELARRGVELVRSRKHAPAPAQLPPVGPPPAAELLMLGALLWPRVDGCDPGPVLALVLDDDLDDPAIGQVLKVVRSLVYSGQPVGPVVVLDELQRDGGPSGPVADRLLQATTAGAIPEALRGYACAVVAASLRRRVESAGHALTDAADTAEADLAPMVERSAAAILDCAARLDRLRGDA